MEFPLQNEIEEEAAPSEGKINSHTVGIVMKEAVRRAMSVIRAERFQFESFNKFTDYSESLDMVTSADLKAQQIYLKIIQENFPLAGIIAEENFSRECQDPKLSYYFTVDPLDGTKAFARRQSEGISSMISLVIDGVVEGVCIGDVMTQECYYTRPDSQKVHRISEMDMSEILKPSEKSLNELYLLSRNDPRYYSLLVQKLSFGEHPLFKNIEVSRGSIALSFAKLWKGQMGGIVLQPGKTTPWDLSPVLGICEKLQFDFYEIRSDKVEKAKIIPPEGIIEFDHELLVVHRQDEGELQDWLARINKD